MNGWAVNFRVEEKSTEGIATGQQQIALLIFAGDFSGELRERSSGIQPRRAAAAEAESRDGLVRRSLSGREVHDEDITARHIAAIFAERCQPVGGEGEELPALGHCTNCIGAVEVAGSTAVVRMRRADVPATLRNPVHLSIEWAGKCASQVDIS